MNRPITEVMNSHVDGAIKLQFVTSDGTYEPHWYASINHEFDGVGRDPLEAVLTLAESMYDYFHHKDD